MIHSKNKTIKQRLILMVLITILTLALALLPVTEKVNAVAAEMAVVYFVYATIFGSCAVSFATDDNFRQGVKKFCRSSFRGY